VTEKRLYLGTTSLDRPVPDELAGRGDSLTETAERIAGDRPDRNIGPRRRGEEMTTNEDRSHGAEDRRIKVEKILSDAEGRDDVATARDEVSEERSRVADRDAFLSAGDNYSGHVERRATAADRVESRKDREASASDRQRLTEDDADDMSEDPTAE